MEKNIWQLCRGHNYISAMENIAWRIVEAQHILSTRKLVDSAKEQSLLEDIIESSKPQTFGKEFIGLHVLLYTPFRYPPLPYGSRFGKKTERSLWYGSITLDTALAEKAYYQFLFLRASHASFGNIFRTFTVFAASIKTQQGIDLTQNPFSEFSNLISSPIHYATSQELGHAMRCAQVQAFRYASARDISGGTNIAILSPKAFSRKKPLTDSFQTWQALICDKSVEFSRASAMSHEYKVFSLENFLVKGDLPMPA